MPVLVLPNLRLKEALGHRGFVIAPSDDQKVRAAVALQARLGTFLDSFTDAFGVPSAPSVFMLRQPAGRTKRSAEAIAAGRNAIAISVLCLQRSEEITTRAHIHRATYSDTFDFYPWMLDRDGERLIGQSPAYLGIHDVKKFKGQSAPALGIHTISKYEVDVPLLEQLAIRWARRFNGRSVNWEDRALFRALDMAFEAMRLPGGIDATHYHVGRSIGLWVSAFEILAHPGNGGRSNRDRVRDLLVRADWESSSCRERRFKPAHRNEAGRPLPVFLYDFLLARRNDYLHGNPVDAASPRLPVSNMPVHLIAASMFRMALAAFLDMKVPPMPTDLSDTKRVTSALSAYLSFRGPQRECERAIIVAGKPPSREDEE